MALSIGEDRLPPDDRLAGAKRAVRDRRVGRSHEKIQRGAAGHLAICTTVQTALRQQRLLFAFQPVFCAATGKIDYFECLLRMRDLRGSLICGDEFITSLEQLGRIGFIDDYVLDRTVQELANNPSIKLGLNVSSRTACEGSWLRSLISLVRNRPGLAQRLVVEITETAAFSDIEETARFVDTLRRAGCRVALDDFGVGHTSLRHLETLAVDTIKIDRSFIRNLARNREKQAFLRDLLSAIRAFGFATVAEGVESAEDAGAVRAEGFGYLQGYHLGPPTIDRVWLRDGATHTATSSLLSFDR
jgi:EAL domain-containing protein (putative c-di-GMP-specific phosphodiesterase class I)